jgi:hypothetical protein
LKAQSSEETTLSAQRPLKVEEALKIQKDEAQEGQCDLTQGRCKNAQDKFLESRAQEKNHVQDSSEENKSVRTL